jgi:hypothetical protein
VYLSEFDLDLPYIADEDKINAIMNEKNCLRNEATKLDYEKNWKDQRRQFRLETRNISAMFERLFRRMETKYCSKILVECVDDVKEERVLNFSGIYTVQVKFNYNNFSASDDYQKKQETLDLLMEGIKIVTENENWNIEPFEMVYSKIREANYTNEWVWKKPVKSADKKFSAEVLCQHGVESIQIHIVLRDKNGAELNRKKVISELPDEFAYTKHLGEVKWLSDNKVALVNKKGDKTWTVNF